MCLYNQIPQKAPGLPQGWTYGFKVAPPSEPELEVFRGLWIQSPNARRYRSIQQISSNFRNTSENEKFDAAEFYQYLGLKCISTYTAGPCDQCTNCKKRDCGACNTCRDSKSFLCLQKVRLN